MTLVGLKYIRIRCLSHQVNDVVMYIVTIVTFIAHQKGTKICIIAINILINNEYTKVLQKVTPNYKIE